MKKLWFLKMVLFVAASAVIIAAVVMMLWNWLIPDLFNGPSITFLQAAGLMILARILFRGFSGFKGGRYRKWDNWKEKLDKMDPEQREKMRELWKKRCGGWDCSDPAETKQ